MLRNLNDPLLSATQGLLRVTYVALFSVAVLLGIAACFSILSGDQASQFSRITAEQRHAGTLSMLSLVPLLAIFGWFVRTLRQIVDTVGLETPFTAENAGRLTLMGWLAVALHGISVAERLMLGQHHGLGDIPGPSGGIILGLTLFILARVFRQGAAMREDLEGTV